MTALFRHLKAIQARRVLAASPRNDFQDVDFSFYFPRAWYEALIARAEGDKPKTVTAFTAARAVPERHWRTPARAGSWSAAEVVVHVTMVETLMTGAAAKITRKPKRITDNRNGRD